MENDEVKKLRARLEKTFAQRDAEAELSRRERMNENEIKDGLSLRISDFYCTRCKCDYVDYRSTGVVETDWTNDELWIAYWNSKHKKCGKWNRRLITNKAKDPYWFKSPKMKRDRGNYYRDLIQPEQSGFDMLYGHKTT